ncbi:MAG TPA: DUF6042 family protein, partial [Micromonosporaceae bacterium]|nr:DUF6042 family protein [Micromonosporaceae bacterium]
GTIACATAGELEGNSRDGYHVVRLEVHNSAPSDDGRDWDDVVETPYFSRAGSVGLTMMTDGLGPAQLDLGGPGLFRVRVARRPGGDDGDTWLLRFWPSAEPAEPPVWLVRSAPAVRPGDPGWSSVLDYEVLLVAGSVRAAAARHGGTATGEQIDAHEREGAYRGGWHDAPLWRGHLPAVLPTGHADLDAAAQRRRQDAIDHRARKHAELAAVAALLGVPTPRTRGQALPLLVAAGLLTVDEAGRYAVPISVPRARDVLSLPAERVRQLDRGDAHARYTEFASDLVTIVSWAAEDPWRTTVPALARRLLATEDEVRAVLGYATEESLIKASTVGDALRLAVGPGRTGRPAPPQTPPTTAPPPPPLLATATTPPPPPPATKWAVARPRRSGTRLGSDDPLATLPTGSPARAGVLTESGDVVVWRGGEPVVLASLPGYAWRQAVETAHGILVTDWSERTVLIRPDGRVDALDLRFTSRPVVDERGRLLAATEFVPGRNARQFVHLVNLSDLSRLTMPGDDHWGHVVAVHGGAVYLRGVGAMPAKRWSPGGDPEPWPHSLQQIDPLTGIGRVVTFDGVLLVRPDGSTHMVPVDDSAALVPGATQLYTLRRGPSAITLFDVTAQPADPRIHWLPVDVSTRPDLGVGPVWEDPDRVLLMAGSRF